MRRNRETERQGEGVRVARQSLGDKETERGSEKAEKEAESRWPRIEEAAREQRHPPMASASASRGVLLTQTPCRLLAHPGAHARNADRGEVLRVDLAHAEDERVHGATDGGARCGCGEWTFRAGWMQPLVSRCVFDGNLLSMVLGKVHVGSKCSAGDEGEELVDPSCLSLGLDATRACVWSFR
jgi:hypothetical protein